MKRFLLTALLSLGLAPAMVWATDCPEEDIPLFTTASSLDYAGGVPTSYVISARDKVFGCSPEQLMLSFAGLPHSGVTVDLLQPGPGEVAGTFTVDGNAPPGTYHVTYTVTDEHQNTTSTSLPLRIGLGANKTPRLDPISDISVYAGQRKAFTVGLSDTDKDLLVSQETLTIDGLPDSSVVTFTRLTKSRIACKVTLAPNLNERGTYRVTIQGTDTHGGLVVAQIRITVQ